MTSRESSARERQLAAVVLAPAVAAIVWVGLLGLYRTIQPQSLLFRAPRAASLGDAVQHDDVESAFAFINSGGDPNRPIEVHDAKLTGGKTVRVSPLLLAVASRSDKTVRMLLGFGARTELPPDVMAACLADDIGAADIARMLRSTVPLIAAHRCMPAAGFPFPLARYAAD